MVEFRVRPSATVFLSGQVLGDTPIPPMELPAGTYTVKFVNKTLAKTVTKSIDVSPDRPLILTINLLEE
ncbi:PEGA domain-containing protein [Archangium minus]|uniref:PEGA domain-containing protein n=1 Tax=Archangium minus TaxID=83450 RepID=A0ABY9WHR6_9BACT|nr:PEGA domain-containing protein [Archangium violaceum]WNG43334.1 PEGA domain-containing protein [Archangium minus]